MERITKIVLHPLTQRIIGVLCLVPTISTLLLDIYNYFCPSFNILELAEPLSLWKCYSLVAFFLAFVLPFLLETSQEYVKCLGRMKYKPFPLPKEPPYTEKDVTVIIPMVNSLRTIDQCAALRRRLNTILEAPVAYIFLVASSSDAAALRRLAHSLDDRRILATVVNLDTARTGKHLIAAGLLSVQTPITIIVNEYVSWPPGIVLWLLAPFKDEMTGAVGILEHVMKPTGGTKTERYWNAKIVKYTEERNKELLFAMGMGDKQQVWESDEGSTCAVKTDFLGSDESADSVWRKSPLDLGSLRDLGSGRCKWWRTYIQYSSECFVQTTPPENTQEGYERWLLKKPPLQSLSKLQSQNSESSLATEKHGLWQKAEDKGIVGLVMRLLHITVQLYTLYRLDPLLSIKISGYQRQNVAAWLLLTQLLTHHVLVYNTSKAIVRKPQRMLCNIKKTFRKLRVPIIPVTHLQTSTSTTEHKLPSNRHAQSSTMGQPKRLLAKICSHGSTVFDYLSLFVLADNFFSMPLLAFPLFFLLCYLYRWRNTELAEQRKTNKELSTRSEVFPYIVMWLVADAFGNMPIAKVLLMLGMLVGKEIWAPIERRREVEKLEKKGRKTQAEMARLGVLRRKMLYPGGRD